MNNPFTLQRIRRALYWGLGILLWFAVMTGIALFIQHEQKEKAKEQSIALYSNMYLSNEPFGKPINVISAATIQKGYWLTYDLKRSSDCVVRSSMALTHILTVDGMRHVQVWPLADSQAMYYSPAKPENRRITYYVSFDQFDGQMLPAGDYNIARISMYDCHFGAAFKSIPVNQQVPFKIQ